MQSRELEIFNELKDKINMVFDVGPRTDLDYFNIKPECEFHLFEPNIEFRHKLKEKLNGIDHNVKINNFGLSDVEEKNRIYYSNIQSFLSNVVVARIDEGDRYNLSTLDLYVKDNNIENIDLLKIDAEGLDYNVLKGSIDTINENKIKYIQFEWWTEVGQDPSFKLEPVLFFDLLKNKYDMYIILEDEIIGFMPTPDKTMKNLSFTMALDEKTLGYLHKYLTALGYGGNIFCVNRELENEKV